MPLANPFKSRAFWLTLLINAIWINVSEIFRYFVFVMPMLRESFSSLENVAPMDLFIFVRWAVWDTILLFAVTGFIWIALEGFGRSVRNAILAASAVWLAIFGILWLGLLNMNLATVEIVAIALVLSWLELAVAGLIVHYGIRSA